MFGVCQDFTERHELRQRLSQTEKLASIGTLAAGIAHEINNRLNYIKVNAITLANQLESWTDNNASVPARGMADLVADIRDGASRIERIVRGLRIFARRSPENVEDVSLQHVFQLGERLCQNEMRHRARFHLDVQGTAWVRADETQLVQVAVNLLINASHAIEEGKREDNEIRVVVGRESNLAFFEVHDTGSGMCEETQRQALTPFFTTKEPNVGTGLGLSICHGIVSSLGGTLTLTSTPGEGTTVRVELPAIEAPRPRLASESPAPTTEPCQLRLLVVDDDPLVARSIGRIFHGHDVEIHIRPQSALAALREGRIPDAILCDLMMPNMTGMTFREALKELDPRLVDRLVVVTGGAFTEQARSFAASGIPIVHKPVDVKVLRATVKDVIERTASALEQEQR